MKVDSRLSVTLHVLLHMAERDKPMTSAELAAHMDTNPVVVRRTMAGLRERGFVRSEKGHGGGWEIAADLDTVTLKDVHVSPKCKLGGEQGVDFTKILNYSRIALAAMAVGVAKGAYEYALNYAKERETFGAPIATRQAIAFMLAEMCTDIDGARLLVWEAAWRMDQGKEASREVRLAKTFCDDMALMVTDRAVQILGGHGYIRDHPVELWLRNARSFAVLDGLGMV